LARHYTPSLHDALPILGLPPTLFAHIIADLFHGYRIREQAMMTAHRPSYSHSTGSGNPEMDEHVWNAKRGNKPVWNATGTFGRLEAGSEKPLFCIGPLESKARTCLAQVVQAGEIGNPTASIFGILKSQTCCHRLLYDAREQVLPDPQRDHGDVNHVRNKRVPGRLARPQRDAPPASGGRLCPNGWMKHHVPVTRGFRLAYLRN